MNKGKMRQNQESFYYIYLFDRERDSQREREHKQGEWEREREKQTPCWAGSPMWGSIPDPWDHDLSQRQMLNHLSHPGAPFKANSMNDFISSINISASVFGSGHDPGGLGSNPTWGSLLSGEPASPSACFYPCLCMLSLSFWQMNK